MEETYERNLKKNEIVFAMEVYDTNENYQERMLLENQIKGLLPMKITYNNERKEYRYEISNLVSLEEIGKERKVDYKLLKSILKQIAEVFHTLDCYMLEEEKILFHPRYIYLDKENNKLRMLFLPERKVEESDFIEFTECLIRMIDQKDELAVWSAYSLERDAKMVNFSYFSFLNTMDKQEEEILRNTKEEIQEEKVVKGKKESMEKQEKEKEEIKFPITGCIRLGIAFGLAVTYFVAGHLISGKYAFEYKKSMVLIGILMAITMGAIIWTIYDMLHPKKE